MKMKPIYQLTSRERAVIVHGLFPEEMPHVVRFIRSYCKQQLHDAQSIKKHWKDPVVPHDVWMEVCGETLDKLDRYDQKLATSQTAFGDLLFKGVVAVFNKRALREYALKYPASPAAKAIDLFI